MSHRPTDLLVVLLLLAGSVEASLRINEIVASNRSGLADEDGELSDWIEIYNEGPHAIDLAGWTLTDNIAEPNKWAFPSLIVAPAAYVVIFASGKDRAAPLHTNFRLASDGEYLALANPRNEAMSVLSPAFPKLGRNIAYGFDTSLVNYRPWRTPTPGMANREDSALGPALIEPKTASLTATEGTNYVISVRAIPNEAPVDTVTLSKRIMYKGARALAMKDDGVAPDALAGDGRYTTEISASTLFGKRFRAGEMLRWSFTTRDVEGRESRLPPLDDEAPFQPEYFGTIVEAPTIESSLPILHWFTDNPDDAVSTSGTRASAFYDGRFYDNIFVKRRGQSGAIGWAKPKLKFDFNPQHHFLYDSDRRLVEEFNLQSHFNDASFMRENLAFGFFNDIGTPASDTRHWHIRLNSNFYGLFSYIEQVDQDFLKQQGLDPGGALYKANGFPSTLAKGVTRALYQKETRKDEPYDDLVEFVEGINGPNRFHYIMDHVNLPAMVNEMAGQSLIRNADRLTKNYYMYRDPKTDLWQRFPWDMDGAFSTSSGLANENYASPLYGDSQHTQAPNQAIYQNFLLDAILDHNPTRQMYLRRLRTLIDTYLSGDYSYFRSEIDTRLALIRDDARVDTQEWGTGNVDNGVRTLKNTAFALRRRELLETFGKDLVPSSQTTGLNLEFGQVSPTSEEPRAEYFQINNPNREAVDLSGWKVSGAVRYKFPSGTVIPRKGTLFKPDAGIMHVVRDVRAFRERAESPRGDEGLFVVGPYDGKLSSRGETLELFDAADRLVAKHSFPGTGVTYESWAAARFSEEELLDDSISGIAVNLSKYAFGEEPITGIRESNEIRYQRIANASDLTFKLEISNDLRTWKEAESFVEQVSEASDGMEQVTATFTRGRESYLRIIVQH